MNEIYLLNLNISNCLIYGLNLFSFSADLFSINENLYFQKTIIKYIPNSDLLKWYQSKIFKKIHNITFEKIGDSISDTSKN